MLQMVNVRDMSTLVILVCLVSWLYLGKFGSERRRRRRRWRRVIPGRLRGRDFGRRGREPGWLMREKGAREEGKNKGGEGEEGRGVEGGRGGLLS